MKAVIVAGGEGRRIRSVARATPKPLLDVGGRSIVEHQILLLRRYEIREIHLTVRGRDLAVFRDRLGEGKSWGVALRYHTEREPLGTAGGIVPVLPKLGRNFLVLYGDVMVNMDLAALVEFHRSQRPAATLVVHPTDHPLDSDLVDLDDHDRIRTFRPKPRPPGSWCRNVGNAGVYVVSQKLADFIGRRTQAKGLSHRQDACATDFVRDVFPCALGAGVDLYGYRTREYLRDIGTPDRLAAVRGDWAARRIERCHLDFALPAIFFDRDGTLCDVVPLLHQSKDVRLLPGAAEAIRRTNEAGCLAVVVTNQPVIARGLCSLEELERIHARLEALLCEQGARLDAIYYCPHHPDAGYPGEVVELKVACECRKPEGGLVRRAVGDLNIDLSRSAFVGDATVDIETGRRLGLRTILVQTGEAGGDGKYNVRPDAHCADVAEAVRSILKQMD